MLRSSHTSPRTTRPSPWTPVHEAGPWPAHVKPSSTRQPSEQPSPLAWLPSSQRSDVASTPSPHDDAHEPAPWPAHAKPGSTTPALVQPSPSTTLPSSHGVHASPT